MSRPLTPESERDRVVGAMPWYDEADPDYTELDAVLHDIRAAAIARDREGLVEAVARRIFSDDRAWNDVPRPELEPYYSEARRILALDAPEAQS